MTLQALTANRLSDGAVVYLRADGFWDDSVQVAHAVDGETEAAALEEAGVRAVADRQVVGPYLIDVVRTEAGVEPTRNKERIRALGPSVQTVLNRSRNNAANRAGA